MVFHSKIVKFAVDELSKISWGTFTVFGSILLLYSIVRKVKMNKILPPGPLGKPWVGVLFNIKKQFHMYLFDLWQSYGSIFSFKMGSHLVVVLGDAKLMRMAFAKEAFSARPKSELSSILGGYGIINSEGPLWKSQRQFLHKEKFGMKHYGGIGGSTQMESRITNEVIYLLESIQREKTSPFNPAPILNCAISNVICSIIMSTRFNHNDEKFQRFMHLFDEGFRLFTMTGPTAYLPIVKYLPGVRNTISELNRNREEMLKFVQFIIDNHKSDLDGSKPRDLVDSYLLKIEEATENGDLEEAFNSFDPERQLQQILLDIFSAGVETLKTTIQWAILHMIHNPEVAKKVRAELDQVVGGHRLPSMADMPNLPYTRATIYEVQRRASVVPMGTVHATDRTVELDGHIIPKDTHVIPLLYAMHMDPEVWDEPEKFVPERFLKDGKVHKPSHFMPFGSGQRMCLGDKLAEMELQLFFSSLMHVFDIEPPTHGELPSLEGIAGATLGPKPFEVNFNDRNIEAIIKTRQQLSKQSETAWAPSTQLYRG